MALALTVKAIGSQHVTAITMPECDITPVEDLEDVIRLTGSFNVTCEQVELSSMLHVIQDTLPIPKTKPKIAYGNVKARLRMLITYYFANIEMKSQSYPSKSGQLVQNQLYIVRINNKLGNMPLMGIF